LKGIIIAFVGVVLLGVGVVMIILSDLFYYIYFPWFYSLPIAIVLIILGLALLLYRKKK